MVWNRYREAQRRVDELHGAIHGGNAGATGAAEAGRNDPTAGESETGS